MRNSQNQEPRDDRSRPTLGSHSELPAEELNAAILRLDVALADLAAELRNAQPPHEIYSRVVETGVREGRLRASASPHHTTLLTADLKSRSWFPFRLSMGWAVAAVSACLILSFSQWAEWTAGLNWAIPPDSNFVETATAVDSENTSVPAPKLTRGSDELPSVSLPRVSVVTKEVSKRVARKPKVLNAASEPVPNNTTASVAVAAASGGKVEAQTSNDAAVVAPQTAVTQSLPEWQTSDFDAPLAIAAMPTVSTLSPSGRESLQTVRVTVGADDLWKMGFTAVPPATNQPVVADFLVGEDGRTLGVRLVNTYR